VSGAVLLCVEFYQSIKGMDRPDALIGNPIFLATYLLFVLYAAKNVFLTWYTNKQKSRGIVLLVGILAVLSVVGILLTKSRGVILGLVAGVFISLCYLAFKAPRRVVFKKLTFNPQKWAIIFCGVITVFCGTVYVTRTATLWTHVPGINRVVVISKNDPTTQARIINAHIALRGFHKEGIQRKLIGWGQDNFVFMWNKYYSPSLFSFDRAILDRAHNKLIDILVMQGIIGLGAYLGLWVTLVVGIFRMRTRVTDRVLALFLLASYFTANLFAFDTTVTYLFFFFMIAYITVHLFQYEPAY
jgi:O-antigen ligase